MSNEKDIKNGAAETAEEKMRAQQSAAPLPWIWKNSLH